jgi:class 3 adenylate cyclase/streptogramin lyase
MVLRRQDKRGLTTLLFTDIVGSTDIAVELGDRRWRRIQARHHAEVRRELKRFGGHEVDTAGDGFFATFDTPAAGVRCACAIVEAVRVIGVEIRAGLHFGEVEREGEKVGGIGVATGARVLAAAGAGDVLVTSTIVELVSGSGLEFADRGTHDLKGIPAGWHLFAVTSVDGKPLPPPPDPAEAAEIRESTAVQPERSTRKGLAWAGLVVVAVAAVVIGVRVAGHKSPAPTAAPQPAILRIEPKTNAIVQEVDAFPAANNYVVGAEHGSLWEQVGDDELIQRRLKDGEKLRDITDVDLSLEPAFGFGSAWIMAQKTPIEMSVTRYDDYPSEHHTTFNVPGIPMKVQWSNAFQAFMNGPTGLWYVNGADTRLRFIDPNSNKVQGSWPTGSWETFGPAEVLPTADGRAVWLCDPKDNEIKRFDVKTHQVSKPFKTNGDITCPVAADDQSVWLLDRGQATVTHIDAKTGEVTGGPCGIGASNGQITALGAYAFKSLWFPAGPDVVRVDPNTCHSELIAMPEGVTAGTVVADEQTHTAWVSNCPSPWC